MTTYLSADQVWAINDLVLQREGVRSVLRDRGALEGACARPHTLAHYVGADVIDQAAMLIIAVALAHPFLDGNKRTAAIAGDSFLRLNGLCVDANGVEFGDEVLKVVAAPNPRTSAEQSFAAWMRSHTKTL